MKPGPRPRPRALKLLDGNPGHRPLKSEPLPRQLTPDCPAWLSPDAKAEWERVAPELARLGLLTLLDRAAFAGYCQSYARWKAAEAVLEAEGAVVTAQSGYLMPRPEVAIARAERRAMQSFAAEFGFTPASRSGIHVPELVNEDDSLLDGRGTWKGTS